MYANARMNMAAEYISFIRYIAIRKVMHKSKLINSDLATACFNTSVIVPILIQYIMIAFHQLNGKPGKVSPPFYKEIVLFIIMTMKHISNYNYSLRFKLL